MNVLTVGSFDGLHVGHLELIRETRVWAGSGRVIVGLNRDEFILAYKGRPPVHPFEHRREMLEAIDDVDAVVVNAGDWDARPCIEVVGPNLITIGDDWLDANHDERRYFEQLGVTPEWMAARGLQVAYIPRTRGVSSSSLRALA